MIKSRDIKIGNTIKSIWSNYSWKIFGQEIPLIKSNRKHYILIKKRKFKKRN